jgi:hypothetical protein
MIRPSPATDRHTEPHERPNGLQQDPADREAAFVRAAFPFSQGRMLSGRQQGRGSVFSSAGVPDASPRFIGSGGLRWAPGLVLKGGASCPQGLPAPA